ncbi:polyprenyl synthetase family protein [Amycolatopsis sp. NPDC021455]|uniref:polyprenyl synthetase family protein n=1 Tax=Amycolatopsis sp. NPDC021455 TaxID=3154901 RepID=UPI0033CCA9E0
MAPLVRAGGKGLRSHLIEVCSRFGRPRRDRLVALGAVVELLHVASLLHDDVIDRAATRRGDTAAHVVAGPEPAVVAGALCMARAAREAARLGSGISRAVAAVTAELAYGELLDVERSFDTHLPVDRYLELVRRKTGELFRFCCVLGALEAGAEPAVLAALTEFGVELGTAFQIMDDCLDLQEDPGGKPTGTDHVLGLFGLPTLYAIQRNTPGLPELLLSPGFSRDDLPEVRALVEAGGGFARAEALAREHFERAVTSLGALASTAPGRELLRLQDVLWPN